MTEKIKNFNRRCYGLCVIKSENSNWNADFTGFPRRLPDENATIYATDKALKYAIRKYWVDNGKDVFVWKSFTEYNKDNKKNLVPRKLEERFQYMKDKFKIKKDEKKDYTALFDVFSKCIDVKLFGITYSVGDSNISLTGPAQISYGINKLNVNVPFSSDILSPYRNKDDDKTSTIGNEVRNLKSYYVYDFFLNPESIKDHFQGDNAKVIREQISINDQDISSFKEALNKAVTNLNTTTKQGSENVMTLFIILKEGSKLQLPTLKNVISITENEDRGIINFGILSELLKKYNDIEIIELFSNDALLTLENVDPSWKIKDILI